MFKLREGKGGRGAILWTFRSQTNQEDGLPFCGKSQRPDPNLPAKRMVNKKAKRSQPPQDSFSKCGFALFFDMIRSSGHQSAR